MTTTKVKVNVFGYDAEWKNNPNKEWFEGKFVFQQVEPEPDVFMDEEGNLTVYPWDDDVEVTLKWCSPLVQLGSSLREAKLPDPPEHAIWITKKKTGKPKKDELPPIDNDQITVVPGPGPDEITIKDKNTLQEEYTYCFAVKLVVGGDEHWFVTDPKITNKGNVRYFRQNAGDHGDDYGSGADQAD